MKLRTFDWKNQRVLCVENMGSWLVVNQLPGCNDLPNDMLEVLDQWPIIKPKISDALGLATNARLPDTAKPVAPFQPRSLRDFMLSERHAVNAARGFVKHFVTKAQPVVRGYERITGKVFPPLKPKPIWYREPVYYFSNHLNVAYDGAEIKWPGYTRFLDYELELAWVITKPLFNATSEQAQAAIGGFMLLNDFSARDLQLQEMRSGFGPQKSKHFVNGLSYTIVTADDVLPFINQLKAEVCINGNQVCNTSTADMRHTVIDVLLHASKDEQLHPGEVFATGTLPNGCAMENDHWLKPGDEIELKIERVGSLSHIIAAQ